MTRPTGLPRDRDRDAAGRPRSARPRDALGRPLPRPAGAGLAAPADEPARPPEAALAAAQQLIDDGQPFRAHEVLEASWKAAPASERELWRGLAQVAVGLTHAQRGNSRGAIALLRRGSAAVAGFAAGADPVPASAAVPQATATPATSSHASARHDSAQDRAARHGIDATAVARYAASLANRIDREGLSGLTAASLTVRLTRPGS